MLKSTEYEVITQMLGGASLIIVNLEDGEDIRLKLQLDNLKCYVETLCLKASQSEVALTELKVPS